MVVPRFGGEQMCLPTDARTMIDAVKTHVCGIYLVAVVVQFIF
jgi:hypothetical protein